ncbi:MAG: Malonyl CoA-acyl carrier protein transacylase [Pseudomonadota bacterium]
MASDKVKEICIDVTASFGAESTEVAEAVNFNDTMQTVIAGSKIAVDKACEVLKAAGAKRALLLPVSAPFHSSLMRPAAEKLKARLENVAFLAPQIPLLNNVDVQIETDPFRIKDSLYRQAFGPVRWVESVQAIPSKGFNVVIECGPGKILSGMIKRINPEITSGAVFDMGSLQESKTILQNS